MVEPLRRDSPIRLLKHEYRHAKRFARPISRGNHRIALEKNRLEQTFPRYDQLTRQAASYVYTQTT